MRRGARDWVLAAIQMMFAEILPGQVIEAGAYSVREEDVIRFAEMWDPQPFHTDPKAAAQSRWAGLIASGWHTCAIAMRLLVDGILANSESFGSPGVEALAWKAPVRPGDHLHLKVTVLSSRRSSSGRIGIVRWRWDMTNQAADLVLSLIVTSFFELRDASGGAAP
jgi:acyl dehydratase